MNLIEFLSYVFEKEIQKVAQREKDEKEYLNANDFENNLDRVSVGIDTATRQVKMIAALKTAEHRQKEHGDDCQQEIDDLKMLISEEYLLQAAEIKEEEFWLM